MARLRHRARRIGRYSKDADRPFREGQLRDRLIRDLQKLEPGLVYLQKEAYLPAKLGTRSFVDILAVDSSQRYVLIEVKRTQGASREAVHEVLKYIEGAKAHLGLRDNELRVIVACADWVELRVPFMSLVTRTTCRVDGYEIELSEAGEIGRILPVGNILLDTDRVVAPWQHVTLYNEKNFEEAVRRYEVACHHRGIESYFLVLLAPPLQSPDGFTSPQDESFDKVFKHLNKILNNDPAESVRQVTILRTYKSAIYFCMQQLSLQDCDRLLRTIGYSGDALDYDGLNEEAALEGLHEAMQELKLEPSPAQTETAYPAKFRTLVHERKWQVVDVRRYGTFARNEKISNEQLLLEICDAQANSKQSVRFSFSPQDKTDLAEAKKRVDICLKDNQPWRLQVNQVLDEIAASGEAGPCQIAIVNTSGAIGTVNAQLKESHRGEFFPFYFITPSPDSTKLYYGALIWDGTEPRLKKLIKEFYDGNSTRLRVVKMHGGYEPRDTQICRRMGLHYRSFIEDRGGALVKHHKLENGLWEPCVGVSAMDEYFRFLFACQTFTSDVLSMFREWDDLNVTI